MLLHKCFGHNVYFAAVCWDELLLTKRKEMIENGRIAKNVFLGVPHIAGHSM